MLSFKKGEDMKQIFIVLILTTFLVSPVAVFADAANNSFGSCMVDNLNGKERKQLAKWIFFAIAAHPEIKIYSNVSQKDVDSSDKYIGALITRLLTVDCPSQMKATYRIDPRAYEKAFELVGKMAMQELMSNKNVTKAITNYIQFADMEKLNKLLSEQ